MRGAKLCHRSFIYESARQCLCFAGKKKVLKTCPNVQCSTLSEQKLLLKINHKSGNTFTLSVRGVTTQAQLGVKQGMIAFLLLYGSYGYASTYFSDTHEPENYNRAINIFSNLRLSSVFGSYLFQHFWTNVPNWSVMHV